MFGFTIPQIRQSPPILIQTVDAYSTVASTLILIARPALNSGQLLLVWARAACAMVRRRP